MINDNPEKRWGLISTFIIHFIMMLIFLVMQVNPNVPEEEYVELAFSVASVRAERYSPPPPPPRVNPPTQTTNAKNSKPREIVKLPQRKMIEEEAPVLKPPPRERVYVEKDPARLSERELPTPEQPAREENKVDLKDRYIGNREDIPSPVSATDTRPGQVNNNRETGEGLSPVQSFSIEWTSGNRERLRGSLPTYPSGLNKSVTIRIRLFVLPDGTIGQMIPLQKGDARLESVALQALQTWRVNKLESNAPQVPQQGIVTFIFRVE